MKRTLILILSKKVAIFILLFSSFGLKAQNFVWQKVIGASQSDYNSCVKPVSDGGFILCGFSNSNISGDKSENNWDTTSGSHDIWIVKLDFAGNIQWENTIGGDGDDRLGDILETSDGGFLIGGTSKSDSSGDKTENGCNTVNNYGDYWVVKLSSSGIIEWQNTIGGCGSEGLHSIDHSSDGGYLLGGTSVSNISCDKTEINTAGINGGGYPGCGGGTSDNWIVKIDSLGNPVCQKTLGRGSWASDFFTDVASTSDGGFIGCGWGSSNYWSPTYGGSDNWIVKLSSSCTLEWQKVIGGGSTEQSGIIKQDYDGNYIVGCTSASDSSGLKTEPAYGLYDFWILKLDTAGNILWQKSIGGSGNDYLNYLAPTFDNGYICGGYSDSPLSGLKTSANFGQNDYWVLKLDSLGNIEWQRTIGGTGNDVLRTVSQMPDGNYFAGGYSNSDISGNKTENSKGGYDYWVMKLEDVSEYNLITGKTFFDSNANFIQDSADISLPYKIIKETNTNHIAFSQADGTYRLSVPDTGSYTVAQIQNPFYLNPFPATHNASFTGMNQIDSLNDFAIQQTIFIDDLQITITPVGFFRPGFNASYNIHFKNSGTNLAQGTITFYIDSGLTFVSSSLTPVFTSTDSIGWQTPLLNPLTQGDLLVTVNVKSSTPIGYQITSSVKIEPLINDENPTDNFDSWISFVTGSNDPNDILVDKDTITTEELLTSPYLDYIIRFQNTGNDTAFSVNILNPIDTFKLDLLSFEFIASSHNLELNYLPMDMNLEFKFENILLPDSNINETGSHGFVRYRIKPKTSLAVHDSVTNYAAIYFDHNLPVVTNIALTRIVYPNNFVEIFETVCDSFISPSGNYTWTSSGLYFDTIPGGGTVMDTIYVVQLTVGNSYSNLNIVSCQNYLSPSGNYTWTTSGTYYDTIPNATGCDSLITVALTIINHSIATLNITACNNYTSPSGNYLWNTSGLYTDTIPNSSGCDSIMTINLLIDTVNITVAFNPPFLQANASGASYQWMYCDSVIIPGEVGQDFIATTNGLYAVIIVQNGCVDTSLCYAVLNVGMDENMDLSEFNIYPNPSSENFIVNFGSSITTGHLIISNTLGENIYSESIRNESKKEVNVENISSGIYFVMFFDNDRYFCKKLVIEKD